jgi:AhpD family alkylhydroperoxidase
MSIISTVAPQDAKGQVAQVYGQVEQAMGRLPNAMRLFSASPDVLTMQWQHIGYYFQHPTLSFPLLASIRMLVSQDNDCAYCIGMNEAMLIERCGFTPEQTAAAKLNPADIPLPEKDKALLLFALKATKSPKAISAAELDALRHLGWNDRDLFDAVNHAARNVAVDILFNSFKIENDF